MVALARREVRFDVPDPAAAGFREEIARQVDVLVRAEEETDMLTWMDAAWAEIDAAATAAEDAANVPHPWSAAT